MNAITRTACVLALALASAPLQAGARPGPVRKLLTVQGFHTLTVPVAFQPGQSAVVTVQGDGDTVLAVAVVSPAGKVVAADARTGAVNTVRFVPRESGTYQIKVLNRGGVPNRFALRTN